MANVEVSQGTAGTVLSVRPAGTFYIETYGCQMNVADSEVVAAILKKHNYYPVDDPEGADIILVNTCAIRENAEQRVRARLRYFQAMKKKQGGHKIIGVLGCMAERLKKKLLEDAISDLVVGPDAYRELPRLIPEAMNGQKAVNVLLSREETYADIRPVHLHSNGISAFISIMRGCDNMCAFCVVPFTRGRERSRDPQSIIDEARWLYEKGYRDITLIGQNVDSYRWEGANGEAFDFADLLALVAEVSPELRIRFSTSHPKDLTEKVARTMAAYPNICKFIHLPVQAGSDEVLERMRRGYTRRWYLDRIRMIRRYVPDVALSTDIIVGFCGETEAQFEQTLDVMEAAAFDHAYMFMYSERPGTYAARFLQDDVPPEVKQDRLERVIALQRRLSLESNRRDVGKTFEVLIEGPSKRDPAMLRGRNSQNKMIVFPAAEGLGPGQYVDVTVTDCTSATLIGQVQSP